MTFLERHHASSIRVAPEAEMTELRQVPEMGQAQRKVQGPMPSASQGPALDVWQMPRTAQDKHAAPECCSMPLQSLSQTQHVPQQHGPPLSDLEEHERLLLELEHEFRCQELQAHELKLGRRSQALQLCQLQLQVPATATALPIAAAPPLYNDLRDLEAMSTAASRKSSAVESGGSRDLSGLTHRDPVPLSHLFCKSFLEHPGRLNVLGPMVPRIIPHPPRGAAR